MIMHNFNSIYSALQHSVCTVKFKKASGETRTMNCTLQNSHLPEEYRNRSSVLAEPGATPDKISVWDVDANDWRAFLVSSVTDFSDPASKQGMLLG